MGKVQGEGLPIVPIAVMAALAVDPASPDHLLAALIQESAPGDFAGLFFKSLDGGMR